jgi:hypothetical protein
MRFASLLAVLIAVTLSGSYARHAAFDQSRLAGTIAPITLEPLRVERESAVQALGATTPTIENPRIDMAGYLDVSGRAAVHREQRRLTEAEFLRLMREPGTIILDARSADKFAMLHIDGAINLSFPDIAIESLARTIPDKSTRILIYCNNNFENAEVAMPSKIARASLNLSTFISLFSYGYENVYELGPLLDPATSTLPFAGTEAPLN